VPHAYRAHLALGCARQPMTHTTLPIGNEKAKSRQQALLTLSGSSTRAGVAITICGHNLGAQMPYHTPKQPSLASDRELWCLGRDGGSGASEWDDEVSEIRLKL
jgi:hypothetical protein